MSISSTISTEYAIKFLKLSDYIACSFSNVCSEKKRCCIILSKDLNIVTTGVNLHIYDTDPLDCKKNILYSISDVENSITKTSKIGGISLNDTIAVLNEFPCFYSAKLLINSGVNTIVSPYPNEAGLDPVLYLFSQNNKEVLLYKNYCD